MKRTGIFGSLVFNIYKVDSEKAPIHFDEVVPGTVTLIEKRSAERILIDLEMDDYVTRLSINSNGATYVSIGKKVDFESGQHDGENAKGNQ